MSEFRDVTAALSAEAAGLDDSGDLSGVSFCGLARRSESLAQQCHGTLPVAGMRLAVGNPDHLTEFEDVQGHGYITMSGRSIGVRMCWSLTNRTVRLPSTTGVEARRSKTTHAPICGGIALPSASTNHRVVFSVL